MQNFFLFTQKKENIALMNTRLCGLEIRLVQVSTLRKTYYTTQTVFRILGLISVLMIRIIRQISIHFAKFRILTLFSIHFVKLRIFTPTSIHFVKFRKFTLISIVFVKFRIFTPTSIHFVDFRIFTQVSIHFVKLRIITLISIHFVKFRIFPLISIRFINFRINTSTSFHITRKLKILHLRILWLLYFNKLDKFIFRKRGLKTVSANHWAAICRICKNAAFWLT